MATQASKAFRGLQRPSGASEELTEMPISTFFRLSDRIALDCLFSDPYLASTTSAQNQNAISKRSAYGPAHGQHWPQKAVCRLLRGRGECGQINDDCSIQKRISCSTKRRGRPKRALGAKRTLWMQKKSGRGLR